MAGSRTNDNISSNIESLRVQLAHGVKVIAHTESYGFMIMRQSILLRNRPAATFSAGVAQKGVTKMLSKTAHHAEVGASYCLQF